MFLFHRNPRVDPKMLHVLTDGTFQVQQMSPSSGSDVLELIGYSRGEVCFRNQKEGQLYIWVVSEQVVRRVVADQGEGSYGFGHSKDGDFVIVRLGCTPLISTKLMRNESFTYYLDTCVETHDKQKKDSWTRTEACLQVMYDFVNAEPSTFVSQDRMFYWKGQYEDDVSIITYSLDTQEIGNLIAPQEDGVNNSALVLGHGFKGQLAASLYIAATRTQPCSTLHIWVLHDDFWHKLLAMPSSPYNNPQEVFVPLTFYYGKEDGAINLLFHRNGEEIVISIPAEDVFSTLDQIFREVSVPSAIPSGIKMEFSSWRKFQATPLGDRIYGKKHKEQALGNKVPEEENKKSGNKISLSFEDDES